MKITSLLNYGLALMILQPLLILAADRDVVQNAGDPLTMSPYTPVNITTVSGITYPSCTITRVEPDGISISYYKGIIKIPFEDLSKEFQKRYDYNPSNAVAYTQFVIQKQAEERKATEAAAAIAARERLQPPPSGAVPVPLDASEALKGQALIAAQTVQNMVQQLGETPEQFQARQRSAIHEAIRQSGQTPMADVDRMVKNGKVEVLPPAPGVVAAEAVQNMVQQLGESQEQFQARKRAALHNVMVQLEGESMEEFEARKRAAYGSGVEP